MEEREPPVGCLLVIIGFLAWATLVGCLISVYIHIPCEVTKAVERDPSVLMALGGTCYLFSFVLILPPLSGVLWAGVLREKGKIGQRLLAILLFLVAASLSPSLVYYDNPHYLPPVFWFNTAFNSVLILPCQALFAVCASKIAVEHKKSLER